jgi:1-acyl-sn-glycerol-3-phosphate acyltransferase
MKYKLTPGNVVLVLYMSFMASLTPLFFLPAFFVYLFAGVDKSDKYINYIGALYSRHLFFMFGWKVKISGLENLPEANNICFVSNHQGFADIPLIVGYIPKKVGFIAKQELRRIPMLNIWMKALGCVLINRKDVRQSLLVIEKGSKQIQKGHPMVIFPEGTRSRSGVTQKFKPGAFKLVAGSDALIVPLTIDGTYKIIEETGTVSSADVYLHIHPAIDVSILSNEEKKNLPNSIFKIIDDHLRAVN